MKPWGILVILWIGTFSMASAQEIRSVDQGMSIIGDRELPRILYIVPWQRTQRKSAPYKPEETLADVIKSVDPEVFAHELEYYKHIRAQEAKRKGRR